VYAKKPGCSEGWVSKSTSQSTWKEVRPAFSRIKHLFLSNGDGWFQQDSARAHTSKATISWLKCNTGYNIQRGDWPPNLLDLSPTENVWSIVAAAVHASPEQADTESHLQKSLRSISLTTVQKSHQFDA